MANKKPKKEKLSEEDTKVVGNMFEPTAKSNVVELYKEKCNTALAKIQKLDEFRASDAMVDYVFRVGRALFDVPLDKMSPDTLLVYGGKMVGAYPYLGQKKTYARAERDVYEQKLKEMEKDLFLQMVTAKYKVTEVKAKVSAEVEILYEFVLQKEAEKNQWENITEACQAMFSFCQSALRVKESEKFASSRISNNG